MKIGIDVGGTKTEGILIDASGKELNRKRIKTEKNYDGTIRGILSIIQEFESSFGNVESIGIGMPGAISADTALRASKEADKARGKAAAGGDREKAKAKAAQASRLYQASAAKRKKEPVAIPDRSYPKGKGASYQEDKDWGYDEDGNSLNPVDIEKRKKEDDDLAGSPNKNGKKNGKKAKRWWDDDGDGKGYEKGEVDGKFPDKDGSKKKKVKEEVESIEEADSLAGQVARWEAARQKRMKQRQSYERPSWIPKDQDHEDNWGSSKGKKD